MGGAQPLAATTAGASIIVAECQPSRIEFRKRTGYLDRSTTSLDEALAKNQTLALAQDRAIMRRGA